jgi:hypothetical protein
MASNLRRNPINSTLSPVTITAESKTVAEFDELPGVYGFILDERPVAGTVTVYEDSTAATPYTIVLTAPLSGQVFVDFNENRGYCIFNIADDGAAVLIDYDGAGSNTSLQNIQAIADASATAAVTAQKDISGGVAGLTLFKINFKNALNTFTSFFTNANTAARTYTFQDSDGTIAHLSDIAAANVAGDTHAAASKTTPVDADELPLVDSAASFGLKKLTWANLKASISGVSVQTVTTTSGAVTSTASAIPIDNTTPQNTEGAALAALDTAITPTSASNTIRVEFSVNLSFSEAGAGVYKAIACLFKDSAADALTARIVGSYNQGIAEYVVAGYFEETAGSTSARTYKIRYGTGGTGTARINSAGGVAVFNGINESWLRVSEIAA